MARTLDELPIYPKALAFEQAVTALLERPAFGRNRALYDQIGRAIHSVPANIREAFEQPTDRAMGKYLFVAKASAGEVCQRLASAHRRRCITEEELQRCHDMGHEMC